MYFLFFFFFFKQKTAYEMRISDWSSDVCSSDLSVAAEIAHHRETFLLDERLDRVADIAGGGAGLHHLDAPHHRLVGDVADATGLHAEDRKSTRLNSSH